MAPVAAFVGANIATILAGASVATGLYQTNVARQGRRDVRAAQTRKEGQLTLATQLQKKARRRQEGILTERRRERQSREGFGSTIVAGRARSLGASGTGGKSLLG